MNDFAAEDDRQRIQLAPCLSCSYKQHWHLMQYQKEGVSQLQLDILLFLYIVCPHQRDGVTLYSSWLNNPSFLSLFPQDSIGRKRKIQIAVRKLVEKGLLSGDLRKLDGNLCELIPLSPEWGEETWVERIVLTNAGIQLAQDSASHSDLCHKFDLEKPQIEYQEKRSRPKSLLVFLQALYGNALGTMGSIVLNAIHHHFTSKIPAPEIQEAAESVWKLAETNDVFVSIGLQKEVQTEDDSFVYQVSALPGLWLDVDIDPKRNLGETLPDSIESVLEWIGRYPLKPTMIVDTGCGIQAYWLFREQWVFNGEEDRRNAKDLARRFQQDLMRYLRHPEWNLTERSSLIHALRLPGTYNRSPHIPSLVYIIEFHDERRYDAEAFEQALLLEPVILEEKIPDFETMPPDVCGGTVIYLPHALHPEEPLDENAVINDESGAEMEYAEDWEEPEEYLPGFFSPTSVDSASDKVIGNASDALIQLTNEFELFHTPDRVPYAEVMANGYKEYYPIHSRPFRNLISYRFFQQSGMTPPSQSLDTTIGYLEMKERETDLQEEIFHRVARRGDVIYVDLANPSGDAVKITAAGWSVERDPGVHFVRPRGMLPLPVPRLDGTIDRLRPFVNVESDEDFHLLVGWLLEAYREGMPKPILYLTGEQGSGKSWLTRLLCALIDPTVHGPSSGSKLEEDIAPALRLHWLPSFDNVSLISPLLSDCLCRISTGGGYWCEGTSNRREDFSLRLNRPMVLNGIDNQSTREDLMDRLLVLNLPAISDENRREEREFWREFSQECPYILGALFNGIASALQREEQVHLQVKPRMVDFARWASAGETGLGWTEGTFLNIYQKNLSTVVEHTLKTDFIATAIIDFMKTQERWEGSALALLQELTPFIPTEIKNSKMWPSSPLTISSSLKKSSAYLRMVGIQIQKPDKPTWDQHEKKAKRVIVITKTSSTAPVTDAAS